ncbi:L,D-transpeptidase family protein [Streptomyces sp. NBC_01707]|jgi:L,D-peptidoglycan transpeptidase YkuD (ErfK/YbiS/YcfS/YnhG family)|uniref:L,D-transpeptidase family protein n=1 Tax=unclassified Streptomyces TaxID=2593676 RepID=UPI00088AF5B0|nr:L,D-transpeptidase family protein [Streptomyces sp. 136MFCol5.1]SCZ16517.1 L,D-peptidoglycan transpeptidase YkuD, ErfK/YbiS/YcfS/YnhG family [Streptomyces sp. 136MFCol5.1]
MRLHRPYISATAAVIVSSLGIAAYHHVPERNPTPAPGTASVVQAVGPAAGQPAAAPVKPRTTVSPRTEFPAQLPGLGPKTLSRIPAETRQVVLVRGAARNSASSKVVLYERVDDGWRPGSVWDAHNAYKGWTDEHYEGDLHSPVGVFALTDAGGRLADPGTKLPYHHSGAFYVSGTGFEGEPLTGSFDYVIAINYNRQPGTSPMNGAQPMGANRGGGIWIHVDHGGPTRGCVSLSKTHMKQLLQALDPADHPVVVMGDAASLVR